MGTPKPAGGLVEGEENAEAQAGAGVQALCHHGWGQR